MEILVIKIREFENRTTMVDIFFFFYKYLQISKNISSLNYSSVIWIHLYIEYGRALEC